MKRTLFVYILLVVFLQGFIISATGKEVILLRKDISYKVKDQIFQRHRPLSGSEIYQSYCSVCHGEKGDGASWTASSLDPSPVNFLNPLNAQKLNRGRMYKSVKEGVERSAMMGWKSQLTDAERNRVITYIRKTFMKVQ